MTTRHHGNFAGTGFSTSIVALFTTKPVGQGIGLAIADAIVVENHAVTVKATSVPEQGTELVITIPVQLI
ncbi:MAG: hypothetical protein FWK01_00310 [Pantanalinema sp. GBBB05]|nr:hypothetical protein [Pantanalinema sp. GBBB05]